jgi:hypothetical protein
MDDLWHRVEQLVGLDLPLDGSSGRTVHVIAIDATTVFVRAERRGRLAGKHADHQVPRADIEAAARLDLHGEALQSRTLRRHLRELQLPGYTLAILRALEADDTPPAL